MFQMFPSSVPAIGAPARGACLSHVRPFGGGSIRSILKKKKTETHVWIRIAIVSKLNEMNMYAIIRAVILIKFSTLGVNLRLPQWWWVATEAAGGPSCVLLVALSTVCVTITLFPSSLKTSVSTCCLYSHLSSSFRLYRRSATCGCRPAPTWKTKTWKVMES